jgi:hypothetical protein
MERIMADEKASTTYAAIVAEAEAAVAAVKDPELRRVAFDRILATLLDAKPPTEAKAETKKPARSKSGSKRSSRDAPTARRGPKAYIEELINDGFFSKQKTIADVKAELANRGHHVPLTSLSGPLQSLTQQRLLRRQKLTTKDDARSTYAYSNW